MTGGQTNPGQDCQQQIRYTAPGLVGEWSGTSSNQAAAFLDTVAHTR